MRRIDIFHSIMHVVDTSALDLNLLAALDALLAERNVTRAARRLGLTQSSTSHALARLRTMLGDPLLVRSGRQMVATPKAESLQAPLARALAELRRVVHTSGEFDPNTSTRTFSLGCPDLVAALLPELMGRLTRAAPSVHLNVVLSTGQDVYTSLASGALDAALAPAPEHPLSGLAQRIVGHVSFCVLARKKHPALGPRKPWSAEVWLQYPHVVVRTGSVGSGFVGSALARLGKPRNIGMTAPSFLVAPFVVAQTDMFFAAPRELTVDIARRLNLAVLSLPIPAAVARVALLWHERFTADPGHTWFREHVALTARAQLQRSDDAQKEPTPKRNKATPRGR
ncbi:MAG: LysR family transcriptional regulator [Polyangiaceae bacterium]|nr:LysR family transcriptional regulator [Polyangiaceae bacterium]